MLVVDEVRGHEHDDDAVADCNGIQSSGSRLSRQQVTAVIDRSMIVVLDSIAAGAPVSIGEQLERQTAEFDAMRTAADQQWAAIEQKKREQGARLDAMFDRMKRDTRAAERSATRR